MSKLLVISSSLRGRSNSEALTERVVAGARDAGHEVELVSLKGKDIRFCIGCLACQKTHKCVQKDDVAEIAEKLRRAETIVFSTPIYFYEMSGQMKTLLDRTNPVYDSDYDFRKVYLLSVAADDAPETPERALSGLQGWIDCFEKAALAGSIFFGGIDEAGAALADPEALQKAYEFGKGLE